MGGGGKSDQEILDTYAGLYGSKVPVDPRTRAAGDGRLIPVAAVLIPGVFLVAWLLEDAGARNQARMIRWQLDPAVAVLPDLDGEDLNGKATNRSAIAGATGATRAFHPRRGMPAQSTKQFRLRGPGAGRERGGRSSLR